MVPFGRGFGGLWGEVRGYWVFRLEFFFLEGGEFFSLSFLGGESFWGIYSGWDFIRGRGFFFLFRVFFSFTGGTMFFGSGFFGWAVFFF